MHGWKGKIALIDLSHRRYSVVEPDETVYKSFIGGKGLSGFFLRPHASEKWDSERMPLVFMTGPLVDTPSPTSGRMTVASISPLTNTIGDTSVGGSFGTQIKRAGFDGLIFTGISEDMVGVHIDGHEITFHSAVHLKGMTNDLVYSSVHSGGSVASIGPAAENGVLFSTIAIDNHYMAGRGGLGLVMGVKNLKYITVKGEENTSIYDASEVAKAREEIFRLTSASPMIKGEFGLSSMGTGALYDLMHARRMMPTDNFQKTRFGNAGTMNAWHYNEKYKPKKSGCKGCHILCKKIGKDKEVLPEFETMSHFSALIGNTSIEGVLDANTICNIFGMDTISAGSTLACYREISGKQLGPNEISSILTDISNGTGIGNDLKVGAARYAAAAGRPECAMAVKGLELPAYDPRGAYGMALAYSMSTRGGCHLRAYPISHEILRKPVATDRFSFSGKARIIKIAEDMNAVVDSLTACKFVFFGASLEEYARALYGVTGVPSSAQDLLKIGERIYYNDRIINAERGFTAVDDDLPPRFFTEDGDSGEGVEVKAINRSDFLETRSNYYKIRGLDEQGLPLADKIKSLNLQ